MDKISLFFNNLKKYKDITEKRSVSVIEIDKALEIVKQFIIDKKRIIYGGQAIDFALKLSDHPGIYQEDSIPDYDFMSPDFYNDSNELAQILHKAGLPNVSSINASHFNSRRVRVNFISVADISYVPENIYKKVPTILIKKKGKYFNDYVGLHIVHPDFQRMDMHRAFNVPFSNPPQEVILHRLEKDQKRFRLLDMQYPLSFLGKKKTEQKLALNEEINFPNTIVSGIYAYLLLVNLLDKLVEATRKQIESAGFSDLVDEKLEKIIKYPPKDSNFPITLLTDDFPSLLELIDPKSTLEKKYYNKFLDNLRPRTILLGEYEIFDVKGELIPTYSYTDVIDALSLLSPSFSVSFSSEKAGEGAELKIDRVAHPNHILLYFLQKYHEQNNEQALDLYISTMLIVEVAEIVVRSLINEKFDIQKVYESLPFFLSAETYGSVNWSIDYVASIKEKKYYLSDIPNEQRLILRPPFGFYPEKADEWPEFSLNNSLYQMDGLECEPFEPLTLELPLPSPLIEKKGQEKE